MNARSGSAEASPGGSGERAAAGLSERFGLQFEIWTCVETRA